MKVVIPWKFGKCYKGFVNNDKFVYTIDFVYDGQIKRLVFFATDTSHFTYKKLIDNNIRESFINLVDKLYHDMKYYYSACETKREQRRQHNVIAETVNLLYKYRDAISNEIV